MALKVAAETAETLSQVIDFTWRRRWRRRGDDMTKSLIFRRRPAERNIPHTPYTISAALTRAAEIVPSGLVPMPGTRTESVVP